MNDAAPIPVIALIGAGFSGVLLAWHLVHRHPRSLHLLLIDDAEAGGVAYRQDLSEACLLNVPAANMGAFPDRPADFLDWLEAIYPGRFTSSDFVPRRFYGAYLQHLLGQGQSRSTSGPVRLERLQARVVDLQPAKARWSLTLNNGRPLIADRTVLALGNRPPAHPRLQLDFESLPGYFQNPWLKCVTEDLDPERPVLLLGSGLTMVDLALVLREQGFPGPIEVISPHGYVPLSHLAGPAWPDFLAGRPWPDSLSNWVGLLRQEVAQAGAEGLNWRQVIDALRPHAPAIWQGLSWHDRSRFLRHLRHRWSLLRHRLPTKVSEQLQAWIAAGSLRLHAGKLDAILPESENLLIRWRRRPSGQMDELKVQRVINCTGPDGDYARMNDPLLVSLLNQGLILPDPLALGLETDANGALLNAAGQPSEHLFSLGPPLRGMYWESTAIPELREQAAQLATHLSATLP